MKRFTVVMPIRDADPEKMRFALQSVPVGPQIIIVDDASENTDTAISLAEEFGGALFREDIPHGLVAATNFGISQATGEYIHVLPPDCYAMHGFYTLLEIMVRTHGFKALLATRWLEMDEMGRAIQSHSDHIPKIEVVPWPAPAFVFRRDWCSSWPDLPFAEAASDIVRLCGQDHLLVNWPMVSIPLRPPAAPSGVLTL